MRLDKHKIIIVIIAVFLVFSSTLVYILRDQYYQTEPEHNISNDKHKAENKIDNKNVASMDKTIEDKEKINNELPSSDKEEGRSRANPVWIESDLERYLVLQYSEPMLNNVEIKEVQKILTDLELYRGRIDGIYGSKTESAVKKLQNSYGVKPTGVMDLDDYRILAQAYEKTLKTSTSNSKPKGDVKILIVLDERTLYVIEDDQVFASFPVAIGERDTPSPIGNWKIISKGDWGEGFGGRWLGLNVPYGKFGIHGTNKPWSIGRAKSHGCFRMYSKDVTKLYRWVTWGTRVYVVGGQFPYNIPWRTIDSGDKGSDVWHLQNRLKELGYYKWRPDGIFGYGTERAVKKFQKDNNLPVDGKVSWNTLHEMDLILFQ